MTSVTYFKLINPIWSDATSPLLESSGYSIK